MDDVRRSSMRSAPAAAPPVAPVAVAAPLLSRCHSVLLQCHQQLDEQEEPAKPASQPAGRGEEAAVCNREVWFRFVSFCLSLFPCLNMWDSLANSAENSSWNISLPCATSSLLVLLLLVTVS